MYVLALLIISSYILGMVLGGPLLLGILHWGWLKHRRHSCPSAQRSNGTWLGMPIDVATPLSCRLRMQFWPVCVCEFLLGWDCQQDVGCFCLWCGSRMVGNGSEILSRTYLRYNYYCRMVLAMWYCKSSEAISIFGVCNQHVAAYEQVFQLCLHLLRSFFLFHLPGSPFVEFLHSSLSCCCCFFFFFSLCFHRHVTFLTSDNFCLVMFGLCLVWKGSVTAGMASHSR